MSNLVHNERVKLRATYMNNMSIGIFIGAVYVPTALKVNIDNVGRGLLFIAVPFVLSFAMHLVASWVLRRLKD